MSPPIVFYRINHFIHKIGFIRLARLLAWINRLIFGCWIPASCKLGAKTKLGYWGIGIVIHSNAVIGANCTIGQNVTIGRNFGQQKVPSIGDNVYIGAGSVIFGEITIGDNVIIGANSVVNKSIVENVIIAGNPAKIIGETNGKSYLELDIGNQ